jgi:hypothetical protein
MSKYFIQYKKHFSAYELGGIWSRISTITSILGGKNKKRNNVDKWYKQYIRFIPALKNRVKVWKERDKYGPSLPYNIIEELKENKIIRNIYYYLRHKGSLCEETRETKVAIEKYKAG